MKLIQRQLFKSTKEFELAGDCIIVRTKSLLNRENSTLGLSVLNPEPVINGSELEFHGRSNPGAVFSLRLNKPNTEEFNAFVDTLRRRIMEEGGGFAGFESESAESLQPEAPGWNVYDEPPEFDEPEQERPKEFKPVIAERVGEDITMLKSYMDEGDIKPLLAALEALKADPGNEDAMKQVVDAYNGLGFSQGAVLTYAPYLKVLLSQYAWA